MKKTIRTMTLDGGCFCFDFINTVYSRKDESMHDYLLSYDDILIWSERVKLLHTGRLNELRTVAVKERKKAELRLKEIIEKRELLHSVFTSVIHNKSADSALAEAFNKTLSKALSKLRLKITEQNIDVAWSENEIDLLEPLWVVYKDAFDIMTSFPVKRMKECKSCGWLFLDRSKNNSRTWCSMQSCGSLEKSKRYYHNVKKLKNAE